MSEQFWTQHKWKIPASTTYSRGHLSHTLHVQSATNQQTFQFFEILDVTSRTKANLSTLGLQLLYVKYLFKHWLSGRRNAALITGEFIV